MILRGYLVSTPTAGVTALRCTDVDFPLDPVLAHRLIDADPDGLALPEMGRANRIHALRDSRASRRPFDEALKAAPLSIREGGRGILLADSEAALIDFIIGGWEPADEPRMPVDGILRSLRSGRIDENEARARLRSLPIWRDDDGRFTWQPDATGLAACHRGLLLASDMVFVSNVGPAGAWALSTGQKAFAVHAEFPAGSGRWIYCLLDGHRVVGWDGERLRAIAAGGALDGDYARRVLGGEATSALETRGLAREVSPDALLPRPDLRPRVLLRVPRRSDLRSTQEAAPPEMPPFDRILFVRDARGALPALEGVPIEEEPTVVAAILSRVDRAAYVPGESSVPNWRRTWAEDEARLVALCEVVP